jgi:hypothetical protein
MGLILSVKSRSISASSRSANVVVATKAEKTEATTILKIDGTTLTRRCGTPCLQALAASFKEFN